MDPFIVEVSERQLKRERARARQLRKSRWWQQQLARGACAYCGRRYPKEELCMDHIVPLIRGGRSTRGNVAVVCKECNNKKRYLLPVEWDDYLRRLQQKGATEESP